MMKIVIEIKYQVNLTNVGLYLQPRISNLSSENLPQNIYLAMMSSLWYAGFHGRDFPTELREGLLSIESGRYLNDQQYSNNAPGVANIQYNILKRGLG